MKIHWLPQTWLISSPPYIFHILNHRKDMIQRPQYYQFIPAYFYISCNFGVRKHYLHWINVFLLLIYLVQLHSCWDIPNLSRLKLEANSIFSPFQKLNVIHSMSITILILPKDQHCEWQEHCAYCVQHKSFYLNIKRLLVQLFAENEKEM